MAKNPISRRDFIKGMAAGAASVATLGILNACEYSTSNSASTAAAASSGDTSAAAATAAASSGSYTPGTYSATATGIGEVTVTMTFD
ncbi:MAG: twin-arginine translocation signal domain-containing protein [Clostridiales bacterium]|nr:twin-arginine translocation signal domain-containing protein [Clostridiales bacterium]